MNKVTCICILVSNLLNRLPGCGLVWFSQSVNYQLQVLFYSMYDFQHISQHATCSLIDVFIKKYIFIVVTWIQNTGICWIFHCGPRNAFVDLSFFGRDRVCKSYAIFLSLFLPMEIGNCLSLFYFVCVLFLVFFFQGGWGREDGSCFWWGECMEVNGSTLHGHQKMTELI